MTQNTKKKQIAVILCGSGFKDGSEIREAVATLHALSALGHEASCFAPDSDQADVVNCLTGETITGEKRNMLVEAARIARGDVQPLSKLEPSQFDGLLLPGGFGAAKNLCDFAFKGTDAQVLPALSKVLDGFHSAGKPIGAICIAPIILALHFKGKGFEMTLGAPSEASSALEALGHRHRACTVSESVLDTTNKIVTTPAYMDDQAQLHEVFQGIHRAVSAVVGLA